MDNQPTDTIPRINDLNYLFEGLYLISKNSSFEKIREGLIIVGEKRGQKEMGILRTGYGISRRLKFKNPHTYWTNARDVIYELMKLGLVAQKSVPRTRKAVDVHRESTYQLTELGLTLLELKKESDESRFLGQFFEIMYFSHPYLRIFLSKLSQREIFIPVYRLSDSIAKSKTKTVDEIINDASLWFSQLNIDGGEIKKPSEELANYVKKKLIKKSKVNNDVIIKLVNDSVEQIILDSYGLKFDTVTFDQLVRLTTQFWVANNSYQVPNLNGLVVYPTAQIEDLNGKLSVKRHRLSEYIHKVVAEVENQFYRLNKSFVPIYILRAAVCYKLKINDEVFDYTLIDLHDKRIETDYAITFLRDVYGGIPPSAKPLIINDKKFYTLTISRKQNGGNYESTMD
jgi:hypothetical protein